MSTLLQINSSLSGPQGHSTRLADRFVAAWRKENPHGRVRIRDLARNPVPQLDAARLAAWTRPAAERNDEERAAAKLSETLIRELDEADVLVLGAPMYNFGIPGQLKAWLDHVARAGMTFRYTENGPVGLLSPKPVFVFSARGGYYADTGHDHQTPFLRQFFGLLGFDDVHFVYAEGVNLGEDPRKRALALAARRIDDLVRGGHHEQATA